MSVNQIAKANWDLAVTWLAHAADAEDVNTTICYTGMAECALKMAQFAVNNPYLVQGIDEYAPPPGAVTAPGEIPKPGPNSPVPAGPTQGPKFWGAP